MSQRNNSDAGEVGGAGEAHARRQAAGRGEQEPLRVVGCDACYTRACALWEKSSVENCNRLVRRWYPKKTDFSKCTRADMRRLERVINSIHRQSLGGRTAYEYDAAYARTA